MLLRPLLFLPSYVKKIFLPFIPWEKTQIQEILSSLKARTPWYLWYFWDRNFLCITLSYRWALCFLILWMPYCTWKQWWYLTMLIFWILCWRRLLSSLSYEDDFYVPTLYEFPTKQVAPIQVSIESDPPSERFTELLVYAPLFPIIQELCELGEEYLHQHDYILVPIEIVFSSAIPFKTRICCTFSSRGIRRLWKF